MAQINSEIRALYVNGTQVAIKDGTFKMNRGGFTRTPVMGGQRKLGSSRQAAPGDCSFTVAYIKGFDLDILNIEDGQIRAVFDRGAEWLLTKADLQDPEALSAGEGDIEVMYNGEWENTKK